MPRAGAMIARPNSSQSSLLLQHRNNRRGGSFTTSARGPLGGAFAERPRGSQLGFSICRVAMLGPSTVRGVYTFTASTEMEARPEVPHGLGKCRPSVFTMPAVLTAASSG